MSKNNSNEKSFFSHNLSVLMKQYGFKQIALAKRLNVSEPTISGYLNGSSNPPLHRLIELSYIFCCPIDAMLKAPIGYTLREDSTPMPQMIPLFHMLLNDYEEDIYIQENFDSSFSFPVPIKEKSRCYAVRTRESDTIKANGIFERSYVIFMRDNAFPQNGDIVAVHLKGKGRIVIRQLQCNEDGSVTLRSDKEELSISAFEKDEKIDILGKVIYKISAI